MKKNKKFFGTAILAITMSTVFQSAQPSTAEAGFFNDFLTTAVRAVVGVDEAGIKRTYNSMVNNYYAAAYYSNQAAKVGSVLLVKYGVAVRSDQAAVVNSSTDSSDAMVQKTAKMTVTTIKTDLKELDQFVEVTKKFDPNDDLIREFCLNKAFQEKALSDARSDTALLIGKQTLVGNATDAIKQCILTAMWYDEVQSEFEAASGNSCKLLNEAIKKNFKVKIDKDVVKDAIKNVPKG